MKRRKTEVLVLILTGGLGTRLMPLTASRLKPAVLIGGKFRLIDIPLSNAYHSEFRKILVLAQGMDKSLTRHIKDAWASDEKSDSFINFLSPQQIGAFDNGDADAVRHVINEIEYYDPDIVLIVPGDHLVKMDYRNFTDFLVRNKGDAAISIIPQPLHKAGSFGSIAIDEKSLITEFREKDRETPLRASSDDTFFASMGIYAFKTPVLTSALEEEGNLFGRDIIPKILKDKKILGYDYHSNNHIPEIIIKRDGNRMFEEFVDSSPDSLYWRDVGTIEEYFEANMDLVSITPKFNLYGKEWPFFSIHNNFGPAKIINPENRSGVESAVICEGSFLSDVTGSNLVISSLVFIEKSSLSQVIVFNNTKITNCRIQRAIIDKHVVLNNMEIGFNDEADRAAGIYIDGDSGIRVVPKGYSGSPLS
ncbi:sugar phosphate nucleotidyltransferase [Spirochaeta isovalerica]|uniref:Glucose-1-phosphate adenylyltransferase n=1 Tax=Spirochaeta isovalerica TaxID=150 RepID=A0A841R9H6_9SPIO|nr:sugar phosphate nucleotidyltransferase [Spirochaeta isovalerica]MBB6480553.1 glucose-1-phosphate adenylyltransferase [Spirochaeta isovalerica]